MITSGSGLQSSFQDEEWEDLADTKARAVLASKCQVHGVAKAPYILTGFLQMTPTSSIHILAKSAENVPAVSQTGHNDWVDLKEKPAEDKTKFIPKDRQPAAQADKVQHEVAALKMAQGLLKGASCLL